jgi:predicted nucleic acid-binding protein
VYLLDKNVLDEIEKEKPHKNVDAWYADIDEDKVYLSVVAVMEGRKGIEKIREKKPSRARELEADLQKVIDGSPDRILPVDLAVAHEWGIMLAAHGGDKADAAVAAIAKSRGFSVVTRNVKHFKNRKVRIINPYKSPPEVIEPSVS